MFRHHWRHLTAKQQLALCVAAVLAAGTAGCDAGDNPAAQRPADKVTYLTAFGTFGREGFAYVAQQKGFFAERGLDVTIQPGQGATSNLKLLAAGRAHFAANDLSGVWILQGNGDYPQIRTIAAIQQRTLNSIMTLEQSQITTPKDLPGRTIGGAAGATPELLWPVYAKLAGIDPRSVTWVTMTAQQTPAALASGRVDGIGQFVVASGTVEKAAGGRKTRALPYSDVLGDLYGNGLVTTTTLIRDNPDLVARFRAALLEGVQWSVQNPGEAGQILHQMVPTQDAAAAAAELEKMAPYVAAPAGVGALEEERVARCMALLSGAGRITHTPAPQDLVDLTIAPAVTTGAGR